MTPMRANIVGPSSWAPASAPRSRAAIPRRCSAFGSLVMYCAASPSVTSGFRPGTALVVAVISLIAGERFEFRPPESIPYGGLLVRDFNALQAAGARLGDSPGPTLDAQTATSTPESIEIPSSEVSSGCLGGSWPYFTGNCLWAVDTPKRRHIVFSLRSPWCSGILRHQPFRTCRPRQK